MNVSPVNLNNTRNYNNKVSFQGYKSSITRDALTATLKKVQPNGTTDNIVNDWWRILEEMREAYFSDRFIDVETFIQEEDVWAIVSLSNGRRLENFVNRQFSQSVTIAPHMMQQSVDLFASQTKNKLTGDSRQFKDFCN